MRRAASTASMVAGVLLALAGVVTWLVVSNTLAAENITVSDDASCLAGNDVNGPFSAYCEAEIINEHALEATGGKTYAEFLGQWLPQSGRGLRSEPCFEFYLNDPESTDPEDLLTDIHAPLEPLS